MRVLEAKRAKDITAKLFKEATSLNNELSKYERGKKALEVLLSIDF